MNKVFAQAAAIAAGVTIAVLTSGGTAAADGHNVNDVTATWQCAIGKCVASGMAGGEEDIGQKRGQDFEPANNEGDLVPAVQAIDTSTDSPHNNTPSHKNLPASSYPADA